MNDELRDELAEALAPWCTGEHLEEPPSIGSMPCSRDLRRANDLLPIVTDRLAKSYREGYEAGSEQADDDVERHIAQARAEAWDEGESDGRHNEHEFWPDRYIANPYRQHAAPKGGEPDDR